LIRALESAESADPPPTNDLSAGGDDPLGCDIIDEEPHPGAKRLSGSHGFDRARRSAGQLLHFMAIDRLDDRVAGRKVAVKRSDPDARPPRDLVEARLRPCFRERGLGRLEQAVAIPLGVGAGPPDGSRRFSGGRAARAARHVGAQLGVSSC
jgi:hypothetical protein